VNAVFNAHLKAVMQKVAGQLLSRAPRVRLFQRFISPDECSRLRSVARLHLEPTEIHNEFDPTATKRTALGAWLPRSDTEALLWRSLGIARADARLFQKIERKIAHVTSIPIANGEPPQILKYPVGGEYSRHPDFLDPHDAGELANGGQRQATFLIYLNTLADDGGGRTMFPRCIPPLRVQPRAGDALLWYNVLEDGRSVDERSVHASEPVVQAGHRPSEKWVLSKWLRQRRYEVNISAFRQAAQKRKAAEGQLRQKVELELVKRASRALGGSESESDGDRGGAPEPSKT
jgi:prolyl 4-hydroxylase